MFHTPRSVKTRGALRKEQCEQASAMDQGSSKSEFLSATNAQVKVNVQPSREVKTEGSLRSRCSGSRTSTEARKQQLILEAAAAKAAIDKDLIEKKISADLAALEEERSICSEKTRDEEIEKWIDSSHNNIVNTVGPSHDAAHDVIAPAKTAGASTDIDKLASALQRAIVSSTANINRENSQIITRMQQIRDLPSYSGDPIEWLHFKRSYDEATELCNLSDVEKIYHLRRCLHGEAKEAVSSLLMCGATADRIVETLELRFGRPDYIIMKIVSQLKRMSPLPQEYHKDIAAFATKIQNFVAASQSLQETDYLRSPELTTTILSKLPNALINRWMDYVHDKQGKYNKCKFELLSDFLMSESTKVAKAGVSYLYSQSRTNRPMIHSVHIVGDTDCKFCKLACHPLPDCIQFKRAMRRDRWRFVRIHRLCHKCLTSCHDRQSCPAATCDVEDCGRDHHRLLHWSIKRSTQQRVEDTDRADGNGCETVTTAIESLGSRVLLKVVPVTIHGPQRSVSTYALLDDGATVSLMSADIANQAGLHGKCITMRVRSAWECSELECRSEIINCNLTNDDGELFQINARKINKLQLPVQTITNVDFQQLNRYKTGFNFNIENVQPKILIGQDNYHLLVPIECIRLHKNGPYVTRTSLGWSLHGALRSAPGPERPPRSARDPRNASAPLAAAPPLDLVIHVSDSTQLNDVTMRDEHSLSYLNELVRNSFALDAIGVSNHSRPNKEHKRAVAILAETATLVNGQWEVGLPWKGDVAMPDSYPNAYRRLTAVERKNIRNPDYGARYSERITHLLDSGYAQEVSGSTPASRTWYLPHFAVDNPNKKKLRVVFDAAATSGGHSLNDYLLQGPDLLESLLGIMLRFREGPIAVTGDIKDMFLRIKIRSEDQNALRFLWRNNNINEPVKKYAMTSLIFGANCSPFIAQFIKNKNALRFVEEMPEAVNAIIKSHYMDDYIDSVNDVSTAKQLIDQITLIHRSGGFEIRNWSCNEPQVIENKPKETLSNGAKEFKLNDQERTLGLLWFLATDTLCFDLTFKKIPADILCLKCKPTKRDVLRIVMSIYDVYGFLAPFTVKAKILLRLIWKQNITWDMKLPDDLLLLFNEWILQIHELKDIRIPRWYFHSDTPYHYTIGRTEIDIQLHVFCDASPAAYAAVAYWRKQYTDGSVCVSLIACKTRVAPIKEISIPRLELQAAVLACRLARVVGNEHRIVASKTYYWCDSTTVLHWIKNENRNYNVFIANRLGEIDSLSKISDWHYIPTYINIADAATKVNKYKLTVDSEWFRGPSFLYTSPDDWPQPPVTETQILVNEEIINTVDVYHLPVPTVPDPNRFSCWNRLRRSTAAVLLFIERCKKTGIKQINCDLLCKAEMLLLKYSQRNTFTAEIQALSTSTDIPKNSRLRSLTPFLDKNGLLRVGGRIDAAQHVAWQTKQPVILEGRDRITRLLTKQYHEAAAHGGNEMIVNELRQRYWIIGLRPTVRTVASQCIVCRLRKVKPKPPRMGDLPEARLMHHHRPFTNCGVDLFGPMDITVGRRRDKRYGVLFTCLTVRAIHIEIVSDLSTDTLIMALRRMAARRGWPLKLFSDNGTNFRGADKELNRAYAEIDKLQERASDKGVEWTFIAPGSPHMGGAWERLIRSVKTALRVVLKERAPREETLITMLIEVEAIVNSRPLTHVSVDSHQQEALTPNHFLIGTASPSPIPGSFDDNEFFFRRQWRIAQRLTDMFWQRWVKEALPVLVPRTKWFSEERPVKPGDLVFICDPNLPRNTWPRGLIVKVHPGKDGRVRVVDVKTKSGILTRPVTRVALLPADDECLKRSDGTRAENVSDVRDA